MIADMGNVGLAVMMIKREIAAATKAMAEGDVAAMIRAHEALKGCR